MGFILAMASVFPDDTTTARLATATATICVLPSRLGVAGRELDGVVARGDGVGLAAGHARVRRAELARHARVRAIQLPRALERRDRGDDSAEPQLAPAHTHTG